MAYINALNSYQKTSIETAEPLKLVVLCYDAAIRDLRDAEELHKVGRMDEAYTKIRHAQDIVTELLVGLDYERGGDIARNLNRLYNFILRQLIGINSRQDTSIYRPLVNILSELKSAWEEIQLRPTDSDPAAPSLIGRPWQASI